MTDEMNQEYFDRLVDEEALKSYLQVELGSASEFTVEYHPEGHSNETLFVTWGDRDLVLRRPPPGETADTAHDILREYSVIAALQDTTVPLPKTVVACEDHSVLGCSFYLVEWLQGDLLREDEPNRLASPEHRQVIGEQLVDTLVHIHEIEYEQVGLADFGYPEGFTQRQVDRWTKQLTWAFERTTEVRDVPLLHDVGEWLDANVPKSCHHTLVHGDYKLDNVMFGPGTPPAIVGVFDWELSTLGDPLTDLGWLLFFWRDSGDSVAPLPKLQPDFTNRKGYPTRQELIDRYERRTGITFANDQFYRTLAVYKMAGLGEMFFRRYLEGNSDDPLYPTMVDRVPALAAHAQRIINGDQPL